MILFVIQLYLSNILQRVASILLVWCKHSPNLKLIFVMILVPGVLNAVQVSVDLTLFSTGYKTTS